jgi:hypothetical protein
VAVSHLKLSLCSARILCSFPYILKLLPRSPPPFQDSVFPTRYIPSVLVPISRWEVSTIAMASNPMLPIQGVSVLDSTSFPSIVVPLLSVPTPTSISATAESSPDYVHPTVLYSPPPVLVDSARTPQIRTESARSPQIRAESVQSPCRVYKESTWTPQTKSKKKHTESMWTPHRKTELL